MPSLPPDIDWAGVFDIACEHGVAAIAQDGLSRLMESNEECAGGFDSPENENVKYEWFGLVFEVESQNRNTGKRAGELSAFFSSKGFRSCVLKGQGLSLLYPNPEHRQSGDIDLWVDGSRDDVIRAVTDAGVKVGHIDVKHSDNAQRQEAYSTICSFGMKRFASGI